MPRSVLQSFCVLFTILGFPAMAEQAPSPETLQLSLKTMAKALSGCRDSFTWTAPRSMSPLLHQVIGEENYQKSLKSLDKAEKFTNFLIQHPERITGGLLVAILSTSDDFSVSVGSTRTEILQAPLKDEKLTPEVVKQLSVSSIDLNACQRALFDAGDDYVELVLQDVRAEDALVLSAK